MSYYIAQICFNYKAIFEKESRQIFENPYIITIYYAFIENIIFV